MAKAKAHNVKLDPNSPPGLSGKYTKFALLPLVTRQILYITTATWDEILTANLQLLTHSPHHSYVLLETVER